MLRGQQQVHAFPQRVAGWSLETESQRGPEFEEKKPPIYESIYVTLNCSAFNLRKKCAQIYPRNVLY